TESTETVGASGKPLGGAGMTATLGVQPADGRTFPTPPAHPQSTPGRRSAQAPRGTEPPRKVLHARRPLDPDDYAARPGTDGGSREVHPGLELCAGHRDEALAYARRLRQHASLWDETEDEGDTYATLVADARRV